MLLFLPVPDTTPTIIKLSGENKVRTVGEAVGPIVGNGVEIVGDSEGVPVVGGTGDSVGRRVGNSVGASVGNVVG